MGAGRAKVDRAGVEAALHDVIARLRTSQDSSWSSQSVRDLLATLETAVQHLDATRTRGRLRVLFAPTGALQDTAIDNGWGEELCALAAVVDAWTAERG